MLDELRHFLLVCEHGTFTEAARRAHLSQPALSASIKRLEDQLGGQLLERGSRGASPTAAGKALKPWAEAALAAVAQGRRAVAAIEGLTAGEVHLGAGATACTYLLPPILTAFRATHPGIELYLREAITPRVRELVRIGALDLAIVTDPLDGAEVWRRDTLKLVAAPELAELPDPASAPFVTFGPGTNHRQLLDRHFPDVTVAMELNSLVAVKAHVIAGMGLALLSTAAVARDLRQGRLVEVAHPSTPLPRTLYLFHTGLDRLSPAAQALRGALLQSRTSEAT